MKIALVVSIWILSGELVKIVQQQIAGHVKNQAFSKKSAYHARLDSFLHLIVKGKQYVNKIAMKIHTIIRLVDLALCVPQASTITAPFRNAHSVQQIVQLALSVRVL